MRRNPLSSQVISNQCHRLRTSSPKLVVIPYQVRSYQTTGQGRGEGIPRPVVIPYQVRSYQTTRLAPCYTSPRGDLS